MQLATLLHHIVCNRSIGDDTNRIKTSQIECKLIDFFAESIQKQIIKNVKSLFDIVIIRKLEAIMSNWVDSMDFLGYIENDTGNGC